MNRSRFESTTWRCPSTGVLTVVTTTVAFALATAGPLGCGDDDTEHHHHVCDPECTGGQICQHGSICGFSCTDPVSPTVCETYVTGQVHFCHAESGMCEPFGETCSLADTAGCASFQICHFYVEAGTCAMPCQDVGGDSFCQLLDGDFVCHEDAAGGVCGPACDQAGGTVDCTQLPPTQTGATLSCNVATGACEAI